MMHISALEKQKQAKLHIIAWKEIKIRVKISKMEINKTKQPVKERISFLKR